MTTNNFLFWRWDGREHNSNSLSSSFMSCHSRSISILNDPRSRHLSANDRVDSSWLRLATASATFCRWMHSWRSLLGVEMKKTWYKSDIIASIKGGKGRVSNNQLRFMIATSTEHKAAHSSDARTRADASSWTSSFAEDHFCTSDRPSQTLFGGYVCWDPFMRSALLLAIWTYSSSSGRSSSFEQSIIFFTSPTLEAHASFHSASPRQPGGIRKFGIM